MLEGAFEVNTVDANNALSTVEVVAGDTISIPSMAWHTLKNVDVTPGRLLAIHSPAVMEEFVREIGQPIDDPHVLPKPPVVPPSDEERNRMMGVIGKYMEVLPPDEITTKETRR